MGKTKIGWADGVWNPVRGGITEALVLPLRWRKPRRVFVNSDLFHEAPDWLRLRHRAGADPTEWPEDLRVREFPGERN